MSVSATSKLSYSALNSSGTKQKQKNLIMGVIENFTNTPFYMENKGLTRRQVKVITGLAVNAVTGRVNELVESGALVESPDKIRCPTTGRLVGLVCLPEGDL